MVNTAPERSQIQRDDALDKANFVRTRRAQLKIRVNQGTLGVVDLLIDTPDYIETMKIYALMICERGYGRVKVNKILSQIGISSSKTIGGLSDRQRAALVRHYRTR